MKRSVKILLGLTGMIAIFFLALIIYYFAVTANARLQPEKLTLADSCMHVYALNGEELHLDKKTEKIGDMPDYLPNAFVAVEDKRFYEHKGLDYKRIVKATVRNMTSFSFREGASTITQQLIKNTHLSGEKTITRKLKELKLARKIEKVTSKEEILELYLNSIYFGHSAFGIGSAAKYYFGKSATELSPAECATLAALVKSPNRYSPFKDAERCKTRRDFVLGLMAEQGYLTNEQAETAKIEPLPEEPAEKQEKSAYLDLVFQELSERFPDISSGEELFVYTYMDCGLQKKLEQTEAESDVTVTVRDNKTNAIKAFYSTAGNINRLPASLIKPLAVYAPALEENLISPATPILDEKVNYGGYSPSNYGGDFNGYMSVRYALSHSVNIPAVKILNTLGLEKSQAYLDKMGLHVPTEDLSLAMALGGMKEGFSLTALTDGYATFLNGEYTPSVTLSCVKNSTRTLYQHEAEKTRVFSDDVCFLMNDMLKTAVTEGTAKKLKTLPFSVCAKTGTGGTSEGNTDAYTIAYTQNDVVGVWLGNRDNSPVATTGGGLPANIAYNVLKELYKNRAPEQFTPCDSVTEVALDKEEYDAYHRLICADPLAPSYLTAKELFRQNAVPNTVSSRFSSPKIEKPQIFVKNSAVHIELCQTKYYDYIVKRQVDGVETEIYRGKYQKVIQDNSVKQGKSYTYSITPVWQGIEGETIILPEIYLKPSTVVPDNWWD